MFSSPPYDMTPTVGRLNLLLAYMETNALNIYFSQIINQYIQFHTTSFVCKSTQLLHISRVLVTDLNNSHCYYGHPSHSIPKPHSAQ